MASVILLLLLGFGSAGLWIPIGMRIERGRQERLQEITREQAGRGGIRLKPLRIRR